MTRQEFIKSIEDINIKGRKVNIDILMWDKSTEKRKAVIYGNYAIFKKPYRWYAVIHIPTGKYIYSVERMKTARLIARAFNQYFPRLRKNESKATAKKAHQLICVIVSSTATVPEFVRGEIL